MDDYSVLNLFTLCACIVSRCSLVDHRSIVFAALLLAQKAAVFKSRRCVAPGFSLSRLHLGDLQRVTDKTFIVLTCFFEFWLLVVLSIWHRLDPRAQRDCSGVQLTHNLFLREWLEVGD